MGRGGGLITGRHGGEGNAFGDGAGQFMAGAVCVACIRRPAPIIPVGQSAFQYPGEHLRSDGALQPQLRRAFQAKRAAMLTST